MERPAFLDMEPPPNYVPGLGRGATGFTTRSDIGPARISVLNTANAEDNGDENDASEKYAVSDAGLFAVDAFDEEDEEADKVYRAVDEKMESRRKRRKVDSGDKAGADSKKSIADQFSDLKQDLAAISWEQWSNIPDVGDLTRRNARLREEEKSQRRFYAVPDSVIASRDGPATERSIEADSVENEVPDPSSAGGSETLTDFQAFSTARDKVLGSRIDQIAGKVISGSQSENFNVNSYLDALDSAAINSTRDISDIKKARQLLTSILKTNPKHASSWIALARLEEFARKQTKARTIIADGCAACPGNEDVWLESIRLHRHHDIHSAKVVVNDALKRLPHSVKLWQTAADLETEAPAKSLVLRKSLEENPREVSLWKQAVDGEQNPKVAKAMLEKAVELIPDAIELWLALARMETAESARKVLNKARKANPQSADIWIAAARLEEQESGTPAKVLRIMSKGVSELLSNGCKLVRSEWLNKAKECEDDSATDTAEAIVLATFTKDMNSEEEDEKKAPELLARDAEGALLDGHPITALAVYKAILKDFPSYPDIWQRMIEILKMVSLDSAQVYEAYEGAVKACEKNAGLWLGYIQTRYQNSEVEEAKKLVDLALEKNPTNEMLWNSALDIQMRSADYESVSALFEKGRELNPKFSSLWTKSVFYNRQKGFVDKAMTLVNEGLEKFPSEGELWKQKLRILLPGNDITKIRETFVSATKAASKDISLWIMYSNFEHKHGVVIRARSILERAAVLNGKNEQLWVARIRLERATSDMKQAQVVLNSAMKEFPNSGALWAENIALSKAGGMRGSKLRNLFVEAIKHCENDYNVLVCIARSFWKDGNLEKAKSWFDKAYNAAPTVGDTAGWYYKFLLRTNSEEEAKSLVKRVEAQVPQSGENWCDVNEETLHQLSPSELLLKVSERLPDNM